MSAMVISFSFRPFIFHSCLFGGCTTAARYVLPFAQSSFSSSTLCFLFSFFHPVYGFHFWLLSPFLILFIYSPSLCFCLCTPFLILFMYSPSQFFSLLPSLCFCLITPFLIPFMYSACQIFFPLIILMFLSSYSIFCSLHVLSIPLFFSSHCS